MDKKISSQKEFDELVANGFDGNVYYGGLKTLEVNSRTKFRLTARGNSQVTAWGNSQVTAWENSQVTLKENACGIVRSKESRVTGKQKIISYEKQIKMTLPRWIEYNKAITTKDTITIYKRVSKDFKTQERRPNETKWEVGKIITHPKWNPTEQECGEGKFHACANTNDCNNYRDCINDKYIKLTVKKSDCFVWSFPEHPIKIAFREAKIVCECDRFGKDI